MTEILVVLAILSMTVAVFITTRPGPSPAMQQEARISEVIAAASRTRTDAISKGIVQTLDIQEPLCPDSPKTLTFFANGTATETRICLRAEGQDAWLHLDPFTALLTRTTAL